MTATQELIARLAAELSEQNEFNRQLSMHTAVSHRSRIAESILSRIAGGMRSSDIHDIANGVTGCTVMVRTAVKMADALLEELAR